MDAPAFGEVESNLDSNVERWREKIEVRLDNRQVFFLFFGSAVVACMLFVLGVMVGKRIESRGQADAPAVQDPLAALDRARQPPLGVAAPDPQLTFPSALAAATSKAKPAQPTRAAVSLPKPPKLAAAAKPTAAAATSDATKTKGKFTLQLSTFVTLAEANAFAQHYPGAFVIGGEVPGKGATFRVRFGNFPSYKEATAAKDAFERQHNMIALVAAR
jgi:cell division septation protein DedD